MNAKLKSILVLIARNPSIRTVEIADRVDCDTDQVQPLLQPHIDAGHIVVIPITAPNGRPANGFMFTDKFRQGDEFRALFEDGAAAPAITAPAITSLAVPAPAAAPGGQDAPGISKIEVAIRYIKANGSATPQALRDLLNLEPRQHPMAYLGGALRDGRLKMVGGHYHLGDAKPSPAPAPKEGKRKAASAKVSPAGRTGPTSKGAVPIDQPGDALASAGAFRCGVWSDGEIELQRGGATIARLTAAEVAIITAQLSQAASTEVRP